MIKDPHFYAVIIGSEILNRRREDKHFDFLTKALQTKGFNLFASFVIKDDVELIENTYTLIKNDPKAMMFSFGGIGSTPDDLTRQLASNIFGDKQLYRHPQFEKDIITRLEDRAYPHPIKMSDLPKDAGLLFNPINNMSGFHLEEKLFFMPGFPEMAQPMINEILSKYIPEPIKVFTQTLIAKCGEGRLTQLMMEIPKELDLSSLPMMNDGSPTVEFSLSSPNEELMKEHFKNITDFLTTETIEFKRL